VEVTNILEFPEYTFDDYINSVTPFEFVYQYEGNSFELTRVLEAMSVAARKAGFINFKKAYASYVKSLKEQGQTIYADSVTQFEGQPLELNCGQWRADDFGVSIYENYGERFACNHPLLPVLRLVNIDTGVEKLKLAYRKGKQWRYIIADKKTLASANSILELANVGVAVNSENAKYLVRYLHDVESLNYDLIPEKNSVSRMGWIEGEGFSPYVDELVFDGDANFRTFFESVQEHGNDQKWLEVAREVRQGASIPARIILAASFASVMVRPMCALPFFVHLWGGTEVGKTVGLMLAASVWANPEVGRYIHTFNSTAVGREKSASFVNSLPLILDELQIVADRKTFDKDIMMLAEGAGRTRGTKSGGIDKTPTWTNCIITSGEMPITNASSGGGAVNRIVEIECKERLFQDPRHVADTVKRNYGFAGRRFVEELQNEGAVETAAEIYKGFYVALSESDTTEKQAMAAAILLTADALSGKWIFQDDHALTVQDISDHLQTKSAVSVNERAYEFLCEFVVSNKNKFCGSSQDHDVWGDIVDGQAYIIRSTFGRICSENGYNPEAFLSWAKSNGKIDAPAKGMTRAKRINGEPARCVILDLPREEMENTGLLDDIP